MAIITVPINEYFYILGFWKKLIPLIIRKLMKTFSIYNGLAFKNHIKDLTVCIKILRAY